MDASEPMIKHVLFYVGLHPGHLMLAEMTDGRYCLWRHDAERPLQCWKADELPQAIGRYNELKAQLAPRGS